MGTAVGTASNAAARVALLGLDEASTAILADCFRQFGIDATPIAASGPATNGFDGCVLPLQAGSEALLRQIREATPHSVIYGVCGSVHAAARFSQYGINAVFETPVQRQAALAVVRATHLLVLHELRRYVRVPLVAAVSLNTGTQVLEATSVEISAGGMSLSVNSRLVVPQGVVVSFDLPGAGTINVRAVVCWARDDDSSAAIRFDPNDEHRLIVRRWVDEYLYA